jgi:hypothetical protein
VFDADTLKFLRAVGGPAKEEADDSPATFAKPTNVAVDGDGNLYVADTLNSRIQMFDADGNFISMFGKAGDGPGFFARPKGIAVDADGHIWVADALQNRVQIFDREGHRRAGKVSGAIRTADGTVHRQAEPGGGFRAVKGPNPGLSLRDRRRGGRAKAAAEVSGGRRSAMKGFSHTRVFGARGRNTRVARDAGEPIGTLRRRSNTKTAVFHTGGL